MISCRYRRATLAVLLCFLLSSCATTKLTAIKDPSVSPRVYHNILVAAPFPDLESRQTAEGVFVARLSESGVGAHPSLSVLFPGKEYTAEEYAKLVLDSGADAMLVVVLKPESSF